MAADRWLDGPSRFVLGAVEFVLQPAGPAHTPEDLVVALPGLRVLIAEQRYYQAQRDNSVARHAYIVNHMRLKSVAGLLNSEDLRVINQLLE